MQRTIKQDITAEGVGVHYGKSTTLTLKPASESTGIVFVRTDITDKDNRIKAIYKNIESIALSTKIKNESGVSVTTIEHLMAAVSSFKIDNLIIEIDAEEVPIMDGGSEDFCFLIECTGLYMQPEKRKKLHLVKEIKVGDDNNYIIAKPSEEKVISFTSDFKSEAIGIQTLTFIEQYSDFSKEIAKAKTIANLLEVEALQKAGMGLGGNLKNTLVYNETRVLNEPALWIKTDFVRHKILDFLGDISLAGVEVMAEFICFKSGHKLNHLLLREIFSSNDNYQII
jgi:UDP-3-O-[3-hydroxymyristoyl] N-acetylglucosamine deacetylase